MTTAPGRAGHARRAILAIDEGTTTTRAAWVDGTGAVRGWRSRAVDVTHPSPGVVEQDAVQILDRTLEAARASIADAHTAAVELVGLALTQQRLTAVLWDAATGEPLAPAVSWQDTRYAAELTGLAAVQGEDLLTALGRPQAFGSPYLWAACQIRERPAARAARDRGTLRLGTVDTWLAWNLTGRYVTTATNASAAGAYLPQEHAYHRDWVADLGFPPDLLPELLEDRADLGVCDPQVLGVALPLLAAVGDQQAGAIGLGVTEPGRVMCLHGTGSFVDSHGGRRAPRYRATDSPGSIPLVAWRADGVTRYLAEAIVPTTGTAVQWACRTFGLGSGPALDRAAAQAGSTGGLLFIPAFGGVMTPMFAPEVRASLTGLSPSTTREEIARALLEGIAHSVVDGVQANARTIGTEPAEIVTGGGLAASDMLLQIQADLAGVPVLRHPNSQVASLRGAAFLAGSDGLLWDSLDAAIATLAAPEAFLPRSDPDERAARRATWARGLRHHVDQLRAPAEVPVP